ncbi:dipeptidase [Aminobacter sp. SR38]|jgi:membrane dipeptidase|uniref:dipeptidase n=1 Tax=Aminobacter TaxID=31988 RepID=UPI00177DE9C6|nr:dipeptidase [Aminobacter sp. SR38]QOF69257.1 dipeptidase [Aminobacter sp. SR38]
MQAVFDGHNDVLFRLWQNAAKGADPVAEFIEGTRQGHIDMPRAAKGGLAGGLCAIYITSASMPDEQRDENGHYAIPLCKPLERAPSLDIALDMASIAFRVERAGGWKICRDANDIEAAEAEGKFAAVLHMEGCEAIDADLAALDVFYAAGLRSLGPVWSRNTVFGHGVPFAFPSSPDTGPGLTDAGKRLVKECNRIGVAIDLAHITEKGFWDVARLSEKPLIVSHSNVHAITPISRNLTDKQLAAVRESNGLVGLNFAVTMLREDGLKSVDTPLSDMIRHIDYLVEHVGIDGVALGSDFDGATVPAEIGDAAGLQNLVAALSGAGYGDDDLAKICRDNWLRVLRSAWHETAA